MDDSPHSPTTSAAGVPETPDRRRWAERIGLSPNILDGAEFRRLYPFASRLHDAGGHGYHYLDEGAGEPVVMVHGNPTWSFFYRNLVLGLRDKFRCLVPDHMGCGLSEKPQAYGYSLERHIGNLESWLESVLPPADREGGRINLVVHDWGGPIGVGYAVRPPERILRLVILHTSVFTAGTMPLRIRLCRWPVIGSFLIRRLNLFSLGAVRMTTLKPLAREVARGFVMPYNSWANRIGVDAFIRDIPLEAGTPTRAAFARIENSVREALAGKPMLIQWGMADFCFTPFFLGLWRQSFPGAEVDELPAGHYLLEDAGDGILARVRAFLERPLP